MTLEEFADLLDRHGGNPAQWPAAARAAAEMLLADDENAVRLQNEALRLDVLLGEATAPMPLDAAAIGRILDGVGRAPGRDLTLRPTGRLIAWASAAMVAFLVVGFAAGFVATGDTQDDDDSLAGLLFGTGASVSGPGENVL
jgi:hypothetical protein